MEDLFDKTVTELRYKSCADRLTDEDKADLVNIINKSISNFENDERNKNYAFYIKSYYFNPGIDYGMDGAYLEAYKLLAKQINEDIIKVMDLKKESIGAFRWLYRSSIRHKINKIFKKYNPYLEDTPKNRGKNNEITLPSLIRKMPHRYMKKFMHN